MTSSIYEEMEPKYWKLPVSVLSFKIESENYYSIGFKIMLRARKRLEEFLPYL